ncbi:MAG: GGDEF domain-containing protein [Roseovarius sp.]
MSSTVRTDAILLGAQAVMQALPHPAFVVDTGGLIYGLNREAENLLGRRHPDRLQDLLSTPAEPCLKRLRAMTRSNIPRLLRLELPGQLPMIFHGRLLRAARNGDPALVLLVADNASAILGKFINLQYTQKKMARRLREDGRRHRELREEALRLKHLSETDPLTGLYNLRALEARVRRALSERPGRLGALVYVDLNDFKSVNDRYGHETGDLLLKAVSRKLTFPPQSKVITARIGGDEFALWMPDLSPGAGPQMVLGLRARVGLPYQIADGKGRTAELRLGVAIGVAFTPREADSYEALRRLADKRMYDDKPNRASRAPVAI